MRSKKIMFIIIALLAVVAAVLTLAAPGDLFLDKENRPAASAPAFSMQALFDGTFTDDTEAYLTDRFPAREELMSLYALINMGMGKTEINDVYLCSDGYLIEKPAKDKDYGKLVNNVNTLAGNNPGVHFVMMTVPTAVTVLDDKLPAGAYAGEQRADTDKIKSDLDAGVRFIDCLPVLEEAAAEQQVYYRTDHHWTSYGAFAAYKEFCRQEGFALPDIGSYKIEEVTDSFFGTVDAKVNDPFAKADVITKIYKPCDITVDYGDHQSDTLFSGSYLDQRDKYSYFLDNIHDKISITVNNPKEEAKGKVLLVIKDSYANCFVPFLTENYEKIIVLDTRYYMYGASSVIEQEGVTDCLILYNLNSADKDAGLAGIY
jgi:hypothetical protein